MCGAFYCKSCLEFGVKVFMDLTLFKGHVVLFLWILCPVWKCILIHLIYIYFFLQQTLSFVVKGSLKAIPGDHFFVTLSGTQTPRLKLVFLIFYYLFISPWYTTSSCQSSHFIYFQCCFLILRFIDSKLNFFLLAYPGSVCNLLTCFYVVTAFASKYLWLKVA